MTDGFSGADLDIFCTSVAMQSLVLASKTSKFKKINNNGKERFMPLAIDA